jgi:hypothetical protein
MVFLSGGPEIPAGKGIGEAGEADALDCGVM